METLPEILSDSLGLKVFYERYDLPMKFWQKSVMKIKGRRSVIYESAERYIPHSVYPSRSRIIYPIREATFVKPCEGEGFHLCTQ